VSRGAVLTSVAFRFNLLYVLGLSVVVFVVMALLYGIFTYNYFQRLQASILEELETLELIHAGQGAQGVELYMMDQRLADTAPRFHYLLTDSAYNKLAGTLEQWPQYRDFGDGWVSFGLQAAEFGVLFEEDLELELLARTAQLSEGGYVLVALRYGEIVASNRLVMETLIRTMLVTVILGVIGGYFTAAAVLRRIDAVNQGIDDIVQGDLSQRIPLGDSKGNVRLLIENFNNMLDQTESLMQGVRTVSDNIAHDLRTPLTRMRNNLAQLQGSVDVVNAETVRQIIQECDELLSTFNALLRIAQLEAGNRLSNFVDVDVGALVQDVVELYEPVAQDKSIGLHAHCEALHYSGDRDLIFQMVVNLLDNAVKYTPQGGAISVTVRVDGDDRVVISVADNGPGIPLADRENVFRRFFRLESSRGLQPGSGLGLSLVKAVVKLHRGAIRLLDNGPGLRVEVALG
jgi:signal transduction histidine kinase